MGIMGVTWIVMGTDVDGKNQDFVKEFMRKAGLNPRPVAWLYGVRNPDRGQHRSRVRHLYGLRRGRYGRFLLVAAWASWRTSGGKWMWNFGGA